MSTRYQQCDQVPTNVLASRVHELGSVVTKGPEAVAREFTMRVPAELDRDADVVLAEAAYRLRKLQAGLKEALKWNWLDNDRPKDILARLEAMLK